MTDTEKYNSKTLNAHPSGEKIKKILNAAISAVEPGAAIRRFVRLEGDFLVVDQTRIDLSTKNKVVVAAIGKAAVAMGECMADLLGHKMHRGLIVPKHLPADHNPRFEIILGGHPVPNENSLNAGERLISLAHGLTEDDLLICLISGGGSALVTSPYPGITLTDMQELTRILLDCGARIDEINSLRRHLDQIKGGGLARAAAPAEVISLILSDVVGSPLEAIASGPTAPDPSTLTDVFAIIERYQLIDKLPVGIRTFLQRSVETPKPGDPLFNHVQNVLVASNELAARAALDQAAKLGFAIKSLGNAWQGEARQVAQTLVEKLKSESCGEKPLCLAAGGETTVTIRGNGLGGRNQELALAAVDLLAGNPNQLLVTLATDGEDGPTDAAGAVVSGKSLSRAQELGLAPTAFLDNNDAYHFFENLGDLLKPGPSGTNVNDLTFLFLFV